MLEGNWTVQKRNGQKSTLSAGIAIQGQRSHHRRYWKTFQHYLTIAMDAGMDLISAKEAYQKEENIFVVICKDVQYGNR